MREMENRMLHSPIWTKNTILFLIFYTSSVAGVQCSWCADVLSRCKRAYCIRGVMTSSIPAVTPSLVSDQLSLRLDRTITLESGHMLSGKYVCFTSSKNNFRHVCRMKKGMWTNVWNYTSKSTTKQEWKHFNKPSEYLKDARRFILCVCVTQDTYLCSRVW